MEPQIRAAGMSNCIALPLAFYFLAHRCSPTPGSRSVMLYLMCQPFLSTAFLPKASPGGSFAGF